jgi:membrane protein YqaA with SNARE-associated domain
MSEVVAASAPPIAPRLFIGTKSGATHALAFVWGLAESTVFFIVPDVLLTRIALRDFRGAMIAGVWTTLGALIGATALWFAARHDHTQLLLKASDWIPGISRELMVRTAQALHTQGVTAVATGALSGQPAKLYAVHAGAQNIPLVMFLTVLTAARFVRFTLTATVAWLAARVLRSRGDEFLVRLHFWSWLAFYTAYFALVR